MTSIATGKLKKATSKRQKTRDQEVIEPELDIDIDQASSYFEDIDLLQNNIAEVNMLKSAGIFTIKGVLMATRKRLCEIKGMSDAKVNLIKKVVNILNPDIEIIDGLHVREKRKKVFKIQTGSEKLNKLLGGGIESMAITTVFGNSGTGKTQLSHTLCVTCQLPTERFSGGKAIFVDTQNTFRPDRIQEIAERYEMDSERALENVSLVRIFNIEQQKQLLDKIAAKLYNEDGGYKIIIFDSINYLFGVGCNDRSELNERQRKLEEFLFRVQNLSEEFNVAIFGTKKAFIDYEAAICLQPSLQKPNDYQMNTSGEKTVFSSTILIALKKDKDTRIAKLIVAPDLPESEATFAISKGGICDVAD